jgi:hypothetical protein
VLLIIAVLIRYVQHDIQTTKRTGRQPEDVDPAKSFVPGKEPHRSPEIIFKHSQGLEENGEYDAGFVSNY